MNTWFPRLTVLLTLTAHASADEFRGYDFSLRLPAALSGFSPYADVAGKGGASAAGKFGSSINPAAAAWSFPERYDFGLSAQYSNIAFDEGTNLHFITGALTFNAREFGVIRFSFGNVFSNEDTIRTAPLLFDYDVNAARLDWAKRLGGWALGIGYGFAKSNTSFRTLSVNFADAERWTSVVRAGVLWQPAPRWLVGVVGEYGYAPTETNYTTPTLLGLVRTRVDDPMRQVSIRPGISYEWRPNALVQFDYQYARFWNDTGVLELHRFSAGADLPLARFLFVRAGAITNDRGNFGWTAGLGIYPQRGLTFDLAYQNDNFPEIQREFGHSQTLNASVSFQF